MDWGGYKKSIVDPVGIQPSPDAGGTTMQADTSKDLADQFRDTFIKSLSERYSVVEQPRPGVVRLQIAITD